MELKLSNIWGNFDIFLKKLKAYPKEYKYFSFRFKTCVEFYSPTPKYILSELLTKINNYNKLIDIFDYSDIEKSDILNLLKNDFVLMKNTLLEKLNGTSFKNHIIFNSNLGYNSHGSFMTMNEFYELEIVERKNYTKKKFKEWQKFYGFTFDSECIWITKDKKEAERYIYMNDPENSNNDVPFIIDLDKGYLINETDDGDYGFLFVLK